MSCFETDYDWTDFKCENGSCLFITPNIWQLHSCLKEIKISRIGMPNQRFTRYDYNKLKRKPFFSLNDDDDVVGTSFII